jgi:hypothetical protein
LGRSGKLAQLELPDYEATAGKAREYLRTQSGKQPGDPQKAIQAVIAVVDADEPPLHLLLGKSALMRFEKKLAEWKEAIEDWKEITIGADYV